MARQKDDAGLDPILKGAIVFVALAFSFFAVCLAGGIGLVLFASGSAGTTASHVGTRTDTPASSEVDTRAGSAPLHTTPTAAVQPNRKADRDTLTSPETNALEVAGRRSRSWLKVNIERGDDGIGTARFSNDGATNVPDRRLAAGRGVPLYEWRPLTLRTHGWADEAFQPESKSGRYLKQGATQTHLFLVNKLSNFGTPSVFDYTYGELSKSVGQRFDHRHVWSQDGKYLYVLVGAPKRNPSPSIRKINVETWEVERQFNPPSDVVDIAWTPHGLIVVAGTRVTNDRAKFGKGECWVNLMPNNSSLQRWRSGIILLDPNDLKVKRGWITDEMQEVAALPDSDIVVLRTRWDGLAIVNLRTGELLDVYSTHDVAQKSVHKESQDQLHFFNPRLSTDGKSLVTYGFNRVEGIDGRSAKQFRQASVNRLRFSKAGLTWEQCRKIDGVPRRLTRRADVGVSDEYLCIPGDQMEVVASRGLSEPLIQRAMTPGTAVALHAATKTMFLCWPDWRSRRLKLRVIRGATDTEVVLADGIDAEMLIVDKTRPSGRRPPTNTELGRVIALKNGMPFEMSVSPDGRRVIVFAPEGAYCVEVKAAGGREWAFHMSPSQRIAALLETSAADDRATSAAQAFTLCKLATVLVHDETNQTLSTAFCIDKRGYFLGSCGPQDALDVGDNVTVVVDAGERGERATTAEVVRIDRELNMALFRTEGVQDLVELVLGPDQEVVESRRLTAFGFGLPTDEDLEAGTFSSVGVRPGFATAIRRSGDEIVAIQFDGALQPGNTGAPVADETGEVIGVVHSGVETFGINFVTPMNRIQQLEWPELRNRSNMVRVSDPNAPEQVAPSVVDATALVVLPSRTSFGTAFCVRESGYFVTNVHVVKGVPKSNPVELVLHAGTERERVLRALVVRELADSDLALLKTTEEVKGLSVLSLEEDDDALKTYSKVTAIGFPYGDALAVEGQKYPTASVNVAEVGELETTILRHEAFEFRTQLNPGNSGGPVVNSRGRVVGVVFATDLGGKKSYAIPLKHLRHLVFHSQYDFTPPETNYAQRHEKTKFSVQITPFLKQLNNPELQLTLTPNIGESTTHTLTNNKESPNVYSAMVAPASPATPHYFDAAFEFRDAKIRGTIEDQDIQVGGKSYRLSNAPIEQSEYAADLTALKRVEMNVDGRMVIIDCSSAIAATIKSIPVTELKYHLTVHDGSKLVTQFQGTLKLEDHPTSQERRFFMPDQIRRQWAKGPVNDAAFPVRVIAEFEHGAISGLTSNCEFKIGNSDKFKLRDVLKLESKDGQHFSGLLLSETGTSTRGASGQLDGLEHVTVRVGEQDVVVPLNHKGRVTVERLSSAVSRFPLNCHVNDLAAGGGGKLLALYLARLRTIVVLDAATRTIKHQLPVKDGVLLAAGATKLIVVYPETHTIQRWSLISGKLEMKASLPEEVRIDAVAMGYAGEGPILMHGYDSGKQPAHRWLLADIERLATRPLEVSTVAGSPRDPRKLVPPPISTSADGKVFGTTGTALVIEGTAVKELSFDDSSRTTRSYSDRHVIPNADGTLFFQNAYIFSREGELLTSKKMSGRRLPTYDPKYCFVFSRSQSHPPEQHLVLCRIKEDFSVERLLATRALPPGRSARYMPPPEPHRYHFYSDLKLLITLTRAPVNDTIEFIDVPAHRLAR